MERLSKELAMEVYAQNMGKAEVLSKLHGVGSHLVRQESTRRRAGPGEPRVALEARHFGPFYHDEIKAH